MVVHNLAFCSNTIFLLMIALHSSFSAAAPSCSPSEREALLDFKRFAVEEDPEGHWFSTWLDPRNSSTLTNSSSRSADDVYDCCKWKGVSCDSQGKVTSIQIDGYPCGDHDDDNKAVLREQVLGELKAEAVGALAAISRLSLLNLECQRFHGSIPEEIGNLTSLTDLSLSRNKLSGLLPKSMRFLQQLESLDLSNNLLSPQEIPSYFFQFPSLTDISLAGNNFIGSIPDVFEFTNSSTKIALFFSDNQLDGFIPSSMQNLTSLGGLDIGYNQFSPQKIPSFLFEIPSVIGLFLSHNNFLGALPDVYSLDNYSQIEFLELGYNGLDGPLPPWIQRMESLLLLGLQNNQFCHQIPSTLLFFPYLHFLDLSFNNFTGISRLPSSYHANDSNLLYLQLSSNKLTAPTIFNRASFPPLKFLVTLDLSHNQLDGPIPDSWADVIPNIVLLKMNNNQLSGTPNFIRGLKNMKMLDLGWNELSGDIPYWLGSESSQNLQILVLSGNRFTGTIPPTLSLLSAMQMYDPITGSNRSVLNVYVYIDAIPITTKGQDLYFSELQFNLLSLLDLSENQLSGRIPPELGRLKGLVSLNLSGNHLDGEIPSSLGNLTNLESLDLSRNKLQGHIPHSFAYLDKLEFVNLSSNRLSGSIPTSPHWLDTFSASSFLDNEGICSPITNSLASLPPCRARDGGGDASETSRSSASAGEGTWLEETMEWSGFALGYPLGFVLGSFMFLLWLRRHGGGQT